MKHEQISTNGVHLHVVTDGPEDGPLVILLHGFPDFWYSWHKLIPELAARGYRVMAPDMRGYNESEKPEGVGAYALGTLADDVLGLIDAAGREKAHLIAHDWGGAIAWWTAMRNPERILKLVVMNVPHPVAMQRHLLRSPPQILRSWYMIFFQLPALPELLLGRRGGETMAKLLLRTARPGAFTDDDIALYKRAWTQPGALTAMINYYRALPHDVRRRPPAGGRVRPPVLLIWGAKDTALGREMAPMSMRYCDDGKLELIEEATHWVHREEPERVKALIEAFLGDPNA
jgi:epoxide hydrolase 4